MTNTPTTHMSAERSPSRLVRLPGVEAQTGLRKSTIYAKMRAGTFPKCVRLSARAVAWRESDVAAWCEARTSEGGDQ